MNSQNWGTKPLPSSLSFLNFMSLKFILQNNIIYLFFLFLSLFNFLAIAQTPRETRAVWVSTNFRLDWPPPTHNESVQKNELIKIFDNIERKNLNTIYFQIRSNGTVLFKSSLEPFSPYITGEFGKFGEYDPLQFAITEAHKRGLEIHAWVNTFRVFSGGIKSVMNNPLHISNIHPEWTYKKSDNSIWINPGLPEVRNHLTELINEIVANYNVDGIHLDFIRYPQNQINDAESFKKYGGENSIADWRRENITKFIAQLHSRIKETNPKIKLGVTPIGIYKSIPNGRGMEGYSDVFQDSRKWLEQGIIDYAVPQIYWDAKKPPRFDVIAKDWMENRFGRNLIIGIAAYKTEVYNEIEREINISRKVNSSGIAFFRYKNIEKKRFFSFAEKALPAEMPWIEVELQLTDLSLSSNFKNRKISINFILDASHLSTNGYFALYQKVDDNNNSSSKLLKVIPNYISQISFALSKPTRINYYYSAIQFDKLWNESSKESSPTKISIPKLAVIEDALEPFDNPVLVQNGDRSSLIIFSNRDEQITLHKISKENQSSFLSKHFIKKGFNEIVLNYNLNNYEEASIVFSSSQRVVNLRTN